MDCGTLRFSESERDPRYVGLIGKEILMQGRAEAMKKSIHDLKTEFVYLFVCVREKNNSFEITVIIFKAYKKCKYLIQKGF